MALPNVTLYYRAASMEHMARWWNRDMGHYWAIEQLGLEYPLSEMALKLFFNNRFHQYACQDPD